MKAFGGRTLHPNIYVLLTGGPGVGKTEAIREVRNFWDKLPDLKQAPSSVSRASLIDTLNDAKRQIVRPMQIPPVVQFNSLQVAATEFGTFLTQYETEFMSTLNDLYDGVKYTERKRASLKEPLSIPHTQLSIIAGTTPGWLGGTLPETAWSEGFASRLMLVYSGDRVKVADPFGERTTDEELREDLTHDLQDIHSMFGQFAWSEEVIAAFRLWYSIDLAPIPNHPRLEHYLPRRHIHFLKLCIIFSAARASDYLITLADYQSAMDMFLEAEVYMPDVFKAMRGQDANIYDEAFNYVYTLVAKEGKPISHQRLITFISQKVPYHAVLRVVEVMIQSGMIEVASVGIGGMNTYRPRPTALHS